MKNLFDLNSLSGKIIDDESDLIPLMTSDDEEAINKEKLPKSLSILPLKNTVLFPGVVIPITATRNKSVKLIVPKIGDKKSLVEICEKNCQLQLKEILNKKQKRKENVIFTCILNYFI